MSVYALSIDAQISEHMAWELNQSGFVDTLKAKAEASPANLQGPYGTSIRTYLPEYGLEDSGKYRVTVYPENMAQIRASRSQMQETFMVNMVVHKRVDVGDDISRLTIEGDKVTKLADQVRKWFEWGSQNGTRILNGTDDCFCARWLRCMRDPIFGRAEMSTYHVVFCPIVHVWYLLREIPYCGEILQEI